MAETYNYTDERGELLFQIVHSLPKCITVRQPGPRGWITGLHGCRLALYRLPQVMQASEVFIVEGEKDVEDLEQLGFVATCNPMGPKQWLPIYTEQLLGKRCYQILDPDLPGIEHGLIVGRALQEAGIEHYIMRLPRRVDVAAFADAACTAADLVGLMRQTVPFAASVDALLSELAMHYFVARRGR